MRLIRLTKSPDVPTFGVLMNEGIPFALTLENPWLENLPNVSCIPPGHYRAVRHHSPRFGDTYWIQDVPGRSEILFHKGNRQGDTAGCVLIGESFTYLMGEPAIGASAAGFNEFMQLLEGKDDFEITIEEHL